MNCPEPRCNYKTPHAHRLDLHLANTGHGTKPREFKGYKQPPKKSKDSEANNGGGKKKGRR